MPLCKTLWAMIAMLCMSACSDNSSDSSNKTSKAPSQTTIQKADTSQHNIAALAYVEHDETYNYEAPIPAQCYTKTEGVHNPCYVCHQTYKDRNRPNQMNDGFQQGSYAFSDAGVSNSWKNLFKDRRQAIAKVSDHEILKYIAEDNYSPLIAWMKTDAWSGVIPEIKNLANHSQAFDDNGLALDGSRWVAFNYKPVPSTFWPTNGSTDDSFIKLADKFAELNGEFSQDVYYANLALVEMSIADVEQVSSIPIDETKTGIDLNADGHLQTSITTIHKRTHYIGDAKDVELSHMLYPEGTAFLHTVRYVDVDKKGEIMPSTRMKEVRYMQKNTFMQPNRIASRYYQEYKEKHFENLPFAVDNRDEGTSNGFGWMLWGFIEDEHGTLRKQHREEQFFCVGCHKTIGTTIDHTFSFPRKLAGAKGWGYIDLKTLRDVPNIGETKGEYLTYLERVGGGDEFRQNGEMLERWFLPNGKPNAQKISQLDNIHALITPSRERAISLNKAYYEVVKEQSYLYGRDVVLSPADNVFEEVDINTIPLKPEFRYQWDIRLDWNQGRFDHRRVVSIDSQIE